MFPFSFFFPSPLKTTMCTPSMWFRTVCIGVFLSASVCLGVFKGRTRTHTPCLCIFPPSPGIPSSPCTWPHTSHTKNTHQCRDTRCKLGTMIPSATTTTAGLCVSGQRIQLPMGGRCVQLGLQSFFALSRASCACSSWRRAHPSAMLPQIMSREKRAMYMFL
mgnify:FL=1